MSKNTTMPNKIINKFDFFFNKLLPKKFIVFWVCTVMVLKGLEIPEEYWEIVKYYMIGGGVISTAGVIVKGVKNKNEEFD